MKSMASEPGLILPTIETQCEGAKKQSNHILQMPT